MKIDFFSSRLRVLLVGGCLALPLAAQAGRPLMVDDAGVNEAGAGHIETWFERGPAATARGRPRPCIRP